MPILGFSLSALSPHHVSSCFIRLGSLSPSASICLKNSEASTSRCGIALCPLSIKELARRPRMLMLLLLPPPPPAPPFLRNSLLRLLMGVSLKGSVIFVALGSFSNVLSTTSGVVCTSSGAGCSAFLREVRPLVLLAPSSCAYLEPVTRALLDTSSSCTSSATLSVEDLVDLRPGRFLGKAEGSSGIAGEESSFRRVGRFAWGTSSSRSIGDEARFFPVLGLPLVLFTRGTGTDLGLGSGSGSGSGAAVGFGFFGMVFCLLLRVNRKSPSCSSYTAASVRVKRSGHVSTGSNAGSSECFAYPRCACFFGGPPKTGWSCSMLVKAGGFALRSSLITQFKVYDQARKSSVATVDSCYCCWCR